MTEEQAILRCRDDHIEDFTLLYDHYIKGIYTFVFFKTHHKETAEDLTSIVFMKALEKIEMFDAEKASFKTWLYSIARNTVTDHYRRYHETQDIEDVWDLHGDEDLTEDTDKKLKLEDVRAALKKLPPDQREIILLRVWGGHSFKEIAEITGKTEAACKMSFKRTVEKLRGDMLVLILLLASLVP